MSYRKWLFVWAFLLVIISNVFGLAKGQNLTPSEKAREEALVICRQKFDYTDYLPDREKIQDVAAGYFVCLYNETARIIAESAQKPLLAKYEFYNAEISKQDSNWAFFNIIEKSLDNGGNETGFDFRFGVARRVDTAGHWDLTMVGSNEFYSDFAPNLPTELQWLNPKNVASDIYNFEALPYAVGDAGIMTCGPNDTCLGDYHHPTRSIDFGREMGKTEPGTYGKDTYLMHGGTVVLRKGECLGVQYPNTFLVTMYVHLDSNYLEKRFNLGQTVKPYQYIGKTAYTGSKDQACNARSGGHHVHIHFQKMNNSIEIGENVTWHSSALNIDPVNNITMNGWKLVDNNTFSRNGYSSKERDYSVPITHVVGDCPTSPQGDDVFAALYKGENCTGDKLRLDAWIAVKSVDNGIPNPVIKNGTDYFIGFPVTEQFKSLFVPNGYNAVLYSKDGQKRACTYGSLSNLGAFFYPSLDAANTFNPDNIGNPTSLGSNLGYVIVRKNDSQGFCDDKIAFGNSTAQVQFPALIPRPIFYKSLQACLENSGGCPSITLSDSSSGGSGTTTDTGGAIPSVPTCSISKSTKPIVFVQKLSGGGEKCVLVTQSISDLSSVDLSALDEVYINDSSLIAQVRLFPGIGWNGAMSLTLTKSATNIGSYPGGFGRLVKSAKVDQLKDNCGNKTEAGVYVETSDGSCLYAKSSKTLNGTTWADRYPVKVYAKGNYIGKLYEYAIGGYSFEIDQKERTPSDRRLYGYLKVEGYEPCDRAKLNALGVVYGNTHEKWQGQCVVLGGAGTRINNTSYDIRVLYTGGKFIVRGWGDPNYTFDGSRPYTEWGNENKDYILLGWPYRAFLVEKKNNPPNVVIPHKEHGQQYAVGTPIDLCFNDGGDPDGDTEYFVIQIYRPYNPSVDFNSLLIEREQMNEAGCYRVKANLPAGGYGYNIQAFDTGVFEPKSSPGMWGAFRVTDPATPVVTDTTANGTVFNQMPLICSDWVWQNYGTARFNLWRNDPNGWVQIGFNLWQPDRCWSPDQFGFTEPGTYQWEAVGLKGTSNMPSGQLHTFVVTGDDPIKPANVSSHNGVIPQVCWPNMGTTVSAVLPTTKAAYSVNVAKDGYSYGNYAWVGGSCYQIPNLGNGTYTIQVDLNTWANTYQAGAWKRTFTVTGMPDPITPQNGVTVATMPTLCQPQQGAWVIKYFFYLYTNGAYAGATPQSTSTCWSPSYSFMNGSYKIVPAIVAWNGKVITMPSFSRNFVLNSTARSGGEIEGLDQTSPVGDISEAELLPIQGVFPVTAVYLPLVSTDTTIVVDVVEVSTTSAEKQPIEQNSVQIFLPIVTR